MLATLSKDENNIADVMFQTKIVNYIVDIMSRKNLPRSNLISCIRIIGNLTTANDMIVDVTNLFIHSIVYFESKNNRNYWKNYK